MSKEFVLNSMDQIVSAVIESAVSEGEMNEFS